MHAVQYMYEWTNIRKHSMGIWITLIADKISKQEKSLVQNVCLFAKYTKQYNL